MFGLLKTTRVGCTPILGIIFGNDRASQHFELEKSCDGSPSVSIDDVSPDDHPGWGGAREGSGRPRKESPMADKPSYSLRSAILDCVEVRGPSGSHQQGAESD